MNYPKSYFGGNVGQAIKLLKNHGINANDQTALIVASQAGYKEIVRLLVEDVDLDFQNEDGDTSLMVAIKNQHEEVVKILVNAGANLNIQNENRETALLLAYFYDSMPEITKLLIEAGSYPDIQDESGYTALIAAAEFERKDDIELLISAKADLNIQDKKGQTALFKASTDNYLEIVILLIAAGADLDVPDENMETAFKIASDRDHEEIVQILLDAGTQLSIIEYSKRGNIAKVEELIENGEDVNFQDSNGLTALMYAFQNGREDIAKILVDAGATVDNIPQLIMATRNNDLDLVIKLIESRTDLDIRNQFNLTALMVASVNGFYDIAKLLVDSDADLDLKNLRDESALIVASKSGCLDIVNLLIDFGANLDFKTISSDTALILATQNGDIEVVRSLTNANADPNIQNNILWTALMSAAFNGDIEILEIILSNENVDTYLKDNHGFTAEDHARMQGFDDIVELLSKYHIPIKEWLNQNVLISKRCCSDIIEYTKHGDVELNKILRGWAGWTDKSELLIENIYEALGEVPALPEDIEAYRGMHGYGNLRYEDLGVGDLLDLNGITSFSIDRDVAIGFSSRGIVIKTIFSEGMKALYLDERLGTSEFNEKELITYANLKVRVTDKYEEHVVLKEGEEDVKIVEVEIYYTGEKNLDNLIFREPITEEELEERNLFFYNIQ